MYIFFSSRPKTFTVNFIGIVSSFAVFNVKLFFKDMFFIKISFISFLKAGVFPCHAVIAGQ